MATCIRNLVLFLTLAAFLGIPIPAHAGVIGTGEALDIEAGEARQVVDEYLRRDEVAAELAALGVDPELARLRAETLSPDELEALAGRITEHPAGASDVFIVLGITFLVLLILHVTGVLRVFQGR